MAQAKVADAARDREALLQAGPPGDGQEASAEAAAARRTVDEKRAALDGLQERIRAIEDRIYERLSTDVGPTCSCC